MKLLLSSDKRHLSMDLIDNDLHDGDCILHNNRIGFVRYDHEWNCYLDTSKQIYDQTLNFSIFYQGIRILLTEGMEIALIKRKR